MPTTAELLMNLQGLDYQLAELERSKEYLPDMISTLEGEIEAARAAVDEAHDQLEATRLEHKRLEMRVKERTVELERLKNHMALIKTNKEYDALAREIDHMKEEITSAEDGILAAMEAIESLGVDIETKAAQLKEIEERNGVQLTNIKSEIASVGTKIKIKQGERENIMVRLDPPMVAIYERVRRGRGSGTVVAVRNRACSGCFKTLPPQLVQEIRRAERIITCDSCGRILIWDEEG